MAWSIEGQYFETVAKATEASGVSALGIDAKNSGKSGFPHRLACSG